MDLSGQSSTPENGGENQGWILGKCSKKHLLEIKLSVQIERPFYASGVTLAHRQTNVSRTFSQPCERSRGCAFVVPTTTRSPEVIKPSTSPISPADPATHKVLRPPPVPHPPSPRKAWRQPNVPGGQTSANAKPTSTVNVTGGQNNGGAQGHLGGWVQEGTPTIY